MRQFDYSYLADRTWDNEIISYISKILSRGILKLPPTVRIRRINFAI